MNSAELVWVSMDTKNIKYLNMLKLSFQSINKLIIYSPKIFQSHIHKKVFQKKVKSKVSSSLAYLTSRFFPKLQEKLYFLESHHNSTQHASKKFHDRTKRTKYANSVKICSLTIFIAIWKTPHFPALWISAISSQRNHLHVILNRSSLW